MSNRCMLHRTHLAEFEQWANRNGWESHPTKADFEVLRLKSGRTTHVFYERISDRADRDGLGGSTHITVQRPAMHLVRQFLRERAAA